MRIILAFLTILLVNDLVHSQIYDPAIDNLIQEVKQDSLMSYVRILSGEDSVYVNGEKVKIEQRIYDSNDLAADYLVEKFESFGLSPVRLDYDTDGTNVVAYQEGSDFPDEFYMICAHYDAVTYYCADDNATGTATVLEAARVLSNVEFPYSIIYALWDEEEIGLLGSHDYAQNASNIGMNIGGVINIDMIGWDSNDDGLVEFHSNQDLASGAIVNTMLQVNTSYELALDPVVQNPGTGASDHASFWDYGYGAILLIEGYWSGDFNPYYHSVNDRVDKFNESYFHRAARLAIGSIAEMATQNQYVSIGSRPESLQNLRFYNYPNPFQNQTMLTYELANTSAILIDIFDPYGRWLLQIDEGVKQKGTHTVQFDAYGLPGGIYTILLRTDREIKTNKMTLLD